MKDNIVYVVTRNSRRVERENYSSSESASARAQALRRILKKWSDPDASRVSVVKTAKPNQIR